MPTWTHVYKPIYFGSNHQSLVDEEVHSHGPDSAGTAAYL